MKRDWDLIRTILEKLEEKANTSDMLHPERITGYDAEMVSYHFYLMEQAALITAKCRPATNGPIFCLAQNLTYSGHELLDTIRNDTAWNRIKTVARERGLDLTMDVIKGIATSLIAAWVKQ